jgi:hypothetical protein
MMDKSTQEWVLLEIRIGTYPADPSRFGSHRRSPYHYASRELAEDQFLKRASRLQRDGFQPFTFKRGYYAVNPGSMRLDLHTYTPALVHKSLILMPAAVYENIMREYRPRRHSAATAA